MTIVIPLGLIVFGLLLALINMRFKKKIAILELEKRRQMQEQVNTARETVNHLAHPIILVSSEWFIESGRMVKHEDARAMKSLITVDTMEELKGFKKGKTLVFFSHQWLSWAEPDPHRIQYNAMLSALQELLEVKGLNIVNTYIWLDYTSIPQTHRGLQRLSINSLTNYAGACDYFIIVAPGRTTHVETGTICDKASYQDRAWCRAEQLAHGCRRGIEEMYLTADGGGLEPVTWDWIEPALNIFSGNLTCCLRGHEGMDQCDMEYLVTPALGLYCELLAADKDGSISKEKKKVLNYFRDNEKQVFPPNFEFSTPGGKRTENRVLFGEVLTLLDELNLKGVGDAEEKPASPDIASVETKPGSDLSAPGEHNTRSCKSDTFEDNQIIVTVGDEESPAANPDYAGDNTDGDETDGDGQFSAFLDILNSPPAATGGVELVNSATNPPEDDNDGEEAKDDAKKEAAITVQDKV